MKKEEAEKIARGMAVACVQDSWDEEISSSDEKSKEIGRYVREVMDRIYSVLVHMDDPEFMKRLTTYGSLFSGILGQPKDVPGLMNDEFLGKLERIAAATQDNNKT